MSLQILVICFNLQRLVKTFDVFYKNDFYGAGLFLTVVIMKLLCVGVGVKLADAADDKGNHSTTSEPPGYGDARSETGDDEEDKT